MKARSINPVRTLPVSYGEIYAMRATQPRFWGPLIGLSLLALVISGALAFGFLLAYYALGSPLVLDLLPDKASALSGLVIILVVLPLHEAVHGALMAYYGHQPRFGIKWYALYATADGALFRRDEYLRVALAPLAAITVIGLLVFLFVPPAVAYWIALALVVNATGAAGDLLMAWIALRYDATALVQDEEDGMRIFIQQPAKP